MHLNLVLQYEEKEKKKDARILNSPLYKSHTNRFQPRPPHTLVPFSNDIVKTSPPPPPGFLFFFWFYSDYNSISESKMVKGRNFTAPVSTYVGSIQVSESSHSACVQILTALQISNQN